MTRVDEAHEKFLREKRIEKENIEKINQLGITKEKKAQYIDRVLDYIMMGVNWEPNYIINEWLYNYVYGDDRLMDYTEHYLNQILSDMIENDIIKFEDLQCIDEILLQN